MSTDRQGRSGLGLEAQREAVETFLRSDARELTTEYIEVESGRRSDRPELAKAIAECKRTGASLIIAKLDRLARSTSFLLGIVESGVDVIFCDLPQIPAGPVGRFMTTQMAAVAELEAGLISERTKAALKAAREKGTQLGGIRVPNQIETMTAVRRQSADDFARNVKPIIADIQRAGVTTYAAIAEALNNRGIMSRRGGAWHASSVRNITMREL